MNRVYIGEIREHLNEEIRLQGFVENFRDGRAMAFIVLRDVTGKVQITIEKEKQEALLPVLENVTPDSVLTVTGTAYESEYVKLNGIEVIPSGITVESTAAALPIQRESSARARCSCPCASAN